MPKIHPENEALRGLAEPRAVLATTEHGTRSVRGENWPNTIVSSIGAYLPPKIVHSDEVVRGCVRELKFPLQKMTGIRNRRMAGEGEYAIDLAAKAINECLANSPYTPADIDLLICCNISRYDAPVAFSCEPSTAIKLKSMMGFEKAVGFDISNACAGVFTGIYVADSFLKSGAANRAIVVSGEYITHLTKTAQKEIKGFMDTRMACLTLGDSGIALILERGKDKSAGLHELEMFSCGEYWPLCVARTTEEEHGGAIMFTDYLKFAEIDVQHALRHALQIMGQGGWDHSTFDYLILHNTSRTTQSNSIREINKLFKTEVVHDGNYLHCLEERGNTASTSHWIAVAENIASGKIHSGDKVVFGISGSGITLGTALYTFDDLPARLKTPRAERRFPEQFSLNEIYYVPPTKAPSTKVVAVGVAPSEPGRRSGTIEMLKSAAAAALHQVSYGPRDIEILIHAGVYRDQFLSEPALAAILAGEMRFNSTPEAAFERKTFAFDLLSGGTGFLNACYVAQQLIHTRNMAKAMVVTSEVENNAARDPNNLLGLQETAAAVVLERDLSGSEGFQSFFFRYYLEFLSDFETHGAWSNDGRDYLEIVRNGEWKNAALESILDAVGCYLDSENTTLEKIDWILPPQISTPFIRELAVRLKVDSSKVIDATRGGPNLFTASFPNALMEARGKGATSGDLGLVIDVGSGIQVTAALYAF
jgi:3-oxoacyl-[acyl-carrier-protein] synthase III